MAKDKPPVEEDDELWDDDEIEEEEESYSVSPSVVVDNVQLPAAWGVSSKHVAMVQQNRKMFNLKHGMLANVPMVCKVDKCPLSDVCTIHMSDRPGGERCPIEIAAVIEGYDKFTRELGIGEDEYFDQSQVKDLVDIEIKLLRTSGVLASVGHFVEMVVIGTDSRGNKLEAPQLHKATEYQDKLLARKAKIISDLNATRKQKDRNKTTNDPSSFASDLMQRAIAAKQRSAKIIDVDAEYVDSDNDRVDVTPEEEA